MAPTRTAALAGVGAVVLFLIADLMAGEPPSFDDPATTIISFYKDHHQAVVAGVILSGIAGALVVWLVAGLADSLREVGENALGTVALAAGIAAVSLGVTADALSGALAQVAHGGDPDFVRGTYQISGFFVGKSSWLGAALTLACALAAWRALPRWYAWTSFAAAPLLALGGLAVKAGGFLAPLGGISLISFLAFLAWILATSLLLWRRTVGEAAVRNT
jgi:hypothetical protein